MLAGPGGFPAAAALAPSAARSATSRIIRCLRGSAAISALLPRAGDSLRPRARKEQQLSPLLLGSPCSLPGAAGLSIRLDTSVVWQGDIFLRAALKRNKGKSRDDSPHPHTHPRRGLREGCSAGELRGGRSVLQGDGVGRGICKKPENLLPCRWDFEVRSTPFGGLPTAERGSPAKM